MVKRRRMDMDLVESVWDFLALSDLINVRAVCRAWQSASSRDLSDEEWFRRTNKYYPLRRTRLVYAAKRDRRCMVCLGSYDGEFVPFGIYAHPECLEAHTVDVRTIAGWEEACREAFRIGVDLPPLHTRPNNCVWKNMKCYLSSTTKAWSCDQTWFIARQDTLKGWTALLAAKRRHRL